MNYANTKVLYQKIFDELQKPLLDKIPGYKLDNTHFKIGTLLHCDTYYHIKKFFEDGENCKLVSALLCEEILIDCDTTLISYANYSHLLLNMTCDLLKKRDKKFKVNYAIANDRVGNKLTFQFKPIFLEKILVIIPALNTGARALSLIKKLISKSWIHVKDEMPNFEISRNFYSILYFGNKTDNHAITVAAEDKVFTSKYLVYLNSKVSNEIGCELCYYDDTKALEYSPQPLDERYLFQVDLLTETPKLIFSMPKLGGPAVKDNGITLEGKLFNLCFQDVFSLDNPDNIHFHGHLKYNGLHFIHYINTDIFYKKNDKQILRYFKRELDDWIANSAREENIKINELIFITPNREKSSGFLDEFTTLWLQEKKTTIISFQPFNEYPENFISLYGDKLKNESKDKLVIFYSDVIYNGTEFKELNTFLKRSHKDYGFDLAWTLLDRSTEITKTRIVRRLKKDKRDFIAFFKLNVPSLKGTLLGNPVQERFEKLRETLNDCHLDSLKLRMIKEIRHCEGKKITQFEKESGNARKFYFPFIHNFESLITKFEIYKNYQTRLDQYSMGLLKMYLYHEITTKLQTQNEDFTLEPLLRSTIQSAQNMLFANCVFSCRNLAIEEDLIRSNIIKLLSRSPFVHYKSVYEVMFRYSIQQLSDLIDELSLSHNAFTYFNFRKLKFFIRRTVELNSNFIISFKFIFFLKTLFFVNRIDDDSHEEKMTPILMPVPLAFNENDSEDIKEFVQRYNGNIQHWHKDVDEFKYFLLYCYKELIEKNPSRAVQLEKLVNNRRLLPTGVTNPETPLDMVIADPFYAFGRVLKMENIGLLSKLKDEFLKTEFYKTLNALSLDESSRNIHDYYFGDLENMKSTCHQQVIELLANSRFKKKELNEVKLAISKMLALVQYIRSLKYNQDNKKVLEENFQIILNSVVNIVASSIDEFEDVNFIFFIEYQSYGQKRNIYTVSRDNSYTENPHPEGLINHMFDGLLDSENGNIQTLIPLIKLQNDPSQIKSFKSKFYKAGFPDNTQPENNIVEIDVNAAYIKDSNQYKEIRGGNMLQYLRFSNISYTPAEGGHNSFLENRGKAVLVISSHQKTANTESFLRFLNIERTRLLLLIKEDILDYLKTLTDNDAFIERTLYRREIENRESLQHGIRTYVTTLTHYLESSKKQIGKIIVDAILGQIFYRGITFLPQDLEKEIITFEESEFEKLVTVICNDPFLGKKTVHAVNLSLNGFPISFPKIIFTVVIPEIIINMKKNSPAVRSPDNIFSIVVNNNTFIFRNTVIGQIGISSLKDARKGHGLDMCQNILNQIGSGRQANFEPLTILPQEGNFTLTLNLRNIV